MFRPEIRSFLGVRFATNGQSKVVTRRSKEATGISPRGQIKLLSPAPTSLNYI